MQVDKSILKLKKDIHIMSVHGVSIVFLEKLTMITWLLAGIFMYGTE